MAGFEPALHLLSVSDGVTIPTVSNIKPLLPHSTALVNPLYGAVLQMLCPCAETPH